MKKKFFAGLLSMLLLVCVLLPGTTVWADSQNAAVNDAKSAVVRLLTEYRDGSYSITSAFGVGKAGSAPEYFITSAHNCLEADGSPAEGIYILLDSQALSIAIDSNGFPIADVDDSRVVVCEVVNKDGISLRPDVAVLKSAEPVADRSCLALQKDVSRLEEGQKVFTLGYAEDPDLLGLAQEGGSTNILAGIDDVNVFSGIVSLKAESTDVIAHSATVGRGSSGGPTVDENGAAVGINTSDESNAAGNDADLYYSVPISHAADILKENDIEFETAKESFRMTTKRIVLLAAIALIIAVAAILILRFKKLGREYLEDLAKKEAQELRLQGMSGMFAGRRFPIETQVTIGRAPSNNIVYPTETEGVSGNHCVVIKSGNQIYVKDTGSTYGTYLNGDSRLPANQLVSVQVGDKISLGSPAETFIITRKGGKL